MAGRIPIVAVGVPAAGLRGGWRDYCIVNAPERSGLGAFVVLLALVSWRAFVVAKRWGVGCWHRAEAASVTGRLTTLGALAAPRTLELRGVFDGAKRQRRSERCEIGEGWARDWARVRSTGGGAAQRWRRGRISPRAVWLTLPQRSAHRT